MFVLSRKAIKYNTERTGKILKSILVIILRTLMSLGAVTSSLVKAAALATSGSYVLLLLDLSSPLAGFSPSGCEN